MDWGKLNPLQTLSPSNYAIPVRCIQRTKVSEISSVFGIYVEAPTSTIINQFRCKISLSHRRAVKVMKLGKYATEE